MPDFLPFTSYFSLLTVLLLTFTLPRAGLPSMSCPAPAATRLIAFKNASVRRLDRIGRNTAAAIDAALVLDLDRRFALGVLAAGDTVHAEVAHHDRRGGDLFNRVKQRVKRAIASGRRLV